MLFQIAYKKKLKTNKKLFRGESYCFTVDEKLDTRYSYKLRVRGGVDIPYAHRTEDVYPLYYRKIDDSLVQEGDGYALRFCARNAAYERSAYSMLRGDFPVGKPLVLSVLAKATGVKDNLTVQAEAYYGETKTRYYYQAPNETVRITLKNSEDYTRYETTLVLREKVDFIMLKISAIGFDGEAAVLTPSLADGERDYARPFTREPAVLRGQAWMGEGFTWVDRPYFSLFLNGEKVFEGIRTDRMQCLCGVEIPLPDGLLKHDENLFELRYGEENNAAYEFGEVQLLTLPKEMEILGVAPTQTVGKAFGVLCYFPESCAYTVETGDSLCFLGSGFAQKGVSVLKFMPTASSEKTSISLSACGKTRQRTVRIFEKSEGAVITGSGDFIYIPQEEEAFYEYLAWYLNADIGDMFTFRSCYRWGGSAEADPAFWKKAVSMLQDLGIYYALMTDGRELNGVNANPEPEIMQSEYFLGEQTHERDGAFTYWVQDADEYEALFYHLLSRKLERNGIYGKYSPVYNKQGVARIYYAEDEAETVKQAYENLVENLRRTAADGATRHTGVTPLFGAFYEAGYKWQGLESMYGNHEILFGALRGMSRSVGQSSFGAHLALQWASVPCDDKAHALRYALSLQESYMHGVTQINTEEGLWNIENPFEGFDRFSRACKMHQKEQAWFNRFVKTHERKGKQVCRMAMLVGKYDGMDCFSTGSVYGQKGAGWEYAAPEYSWDMLQTLFPQAVIGAIYHFVKKDGKKGLREKDKEYLDAWGYMYRDEVKDYQSLGYYSQTPYGAIDLTFDGANNLSDYPFIFMLGWNTCTEEQLKRLCAYLEQGGRLLLAGPHLYENVRRDEVFQGGGKRLESPWVEKLLSYCEKGSLIFFDGEKYPVEIGEAYAQALKQEGARFSCPYVGEVDRVSYTEYAREDGSTALYLLNIDWWSNQPAACSLRIGEDVYPVSLTDNRIKTVLVSEDGKTAVLCSHAEIDCREITNQSAVFVGFGTCKIVIFKDGKRTEKTIRVRGEKTVVL